MLFEARELKPYGEPVSTEDLKVGEVYFAILFFETDGVVPQMLPRVFIGMNLELGDENKYYFQDYPSYRRGVRFDSAEDEAAIEDEARFFQPIFETGVEKRTYTYEKALEILMYCSLRRRKPSGDH
jgi:hypothetical protein